MTFMPGAPSGEGPADAELLRRAVAGNHAAFGDLFDRHAPAIYNFCLRRSGDRTAAEDLVSATFLHAWRRRADVVLDHDSLLPWLYGVAANLTSRHIRGARRYEAARARLPRPALEADPADDVAVRLDEGRRAGRVSEAIASLPERDQDLLVLCAWQGFSYREAALALGVPVGTVRSRLSRARGRLRDLLAEPEEPIGDERVEHASACREEGDR